MLRSGTGRTLTTCFILGLSSGLPLALVTSTLQAWYTTAGVDMVSIGFLGLIAQPYVFKFLWAPLLDKYQLSAQTSLRKDWILLMQALLIITTFGLSFLTPQSHGHLIAALACLVAFFSATQDIGIDAYRTDILPDSLRGIGAAIAIAGYRLGIITTGGLALFLADWLGWQLTYQISALLILIGIIGTWIGPRVPPSNHQAKSIGYLDAFKELSRRPRLLSIILLVLTYRLGESFTSSVSSMVTPFLIRELGMTLSKVGIMTKGVGITATILGGLLGGYIMMRLSLFRALLYFGLFQTISNFLFLILSLITPKLWMVATVVGIENLCSGLGTAAFVAFLMSICQKPYTAAQFALFSALAASNRIIIAPLSGVIVQYYGWTDYFIVSLMATFPAIGIILWMKSQENSPLQINSPSLS